jgi:hypothetical protein
MSFKFKIGQTVKKVGDESGERFRVSALMLNGYVQVRSLRTHYPQIVEAEEFEEIQIPLDNSAPL